MSKVKLYYDQNKIFGKGNKYNRLSGYRFIIDDVDMTELEITGIELKIEAGSLPELLVKIRLDKVEFDIENVQIRTENYTSIGT